MGRYSKAFKDEAIKLVTEQKYNAAEASRKLGLPNTTFDSWLAKAGWVHDKAAPLPDNPAVLKVQIRDLQDQVKRLEMEKDILKKATAFFASQSR
jgi:transposase